MRVTILSADIGHVTSGQSRFAISLARGLATIGTEVSICAEQSLPDAARVLSEQGVEIYTRNVNTQSRLFKARLFSRFSTVGRDLAELALSRTDPDWVVVLSDSAVAAVKHLGRKRCAYICNGDLSLMFLSPSFYTESSIAKHILARRFASHVVENAKAAAEYDVLLGNSEFSRRFMSYLYSIPFDGYVYPPVDTAFFTPPASSERSYVLAVLRNQSEQGIALLERIAKETAVKVIGGARVLGAESLGVVSDHALRSLYGDAKFLAFSNPAELFGYAVAEALACGTPVLAFNSGGPAELIQRGRNGWLCDSNDSFVRTALSLAKDDIGSSFSSGAVESAKAFSLESSSRRLVAFLTSASSNLVDQRS